MGWWSVLNPVHDVKAAAHVVDDGAKDFESALKDATKETVKVVTSMSPSQIGHTALDVLGMVPVVGTVANLANAGWYAADGDWADAGMSALAAIPIEGDAVDALKLGKDGVEIAGDATEAGEAGAKIADDAANVRPAGEPSDEPTVWVQHGKQGPIREYSPDQVAGTPDVGASVTTDEGSGAVVSRGDPPNKSDVRISEPDTPGPPPLPPAVAKKLGGLADRAGEEVGDVIRSRGGSGANVRLVGQWATKTLREAAEAAVAGDPSAETAVKVAKDAPRLGQRY